VLVPEGTRLCDGVSAIRSHPIDAQGDTPLRVASALAASPLFDAVVLDGYVFDVGLQRRLRRSRATDVVDDLRLPTDCDLAVNPSPGGESLRPDGARAFSAGPAYALIRASVVSAREMASRGDREPRTVAGFNRVQPIRRGLGLSVSHALLDRDSTVAVTRVVGPDSMELAGDACRANLCWLHHQTSPAVSGLHRLRWCSRHHRGPGRVRRMSSVITAAVEQPGSAGSRPSAPRMRGRR